MPLEAAARRVLARPRGRRLAARDWQVAVDATVSAFLPWGASSFGGRARTLMEQALLPRLDAYHDRAQARLEALYVLFVPNMP